MGVTSRRAKRRMSGGHTVACQLLGPPGNKKIGELNAAEQTYVLECGHWSHDVVRILVGWKDDK